MPLTGTKVLPSGSTEYLVVFEPPSSVSTVITLTSPARNVAKAWPWVMCALLIFLSGCGFNKSGLVDPALLQPSGWKSNTRILNSRSFDQYKAAVQDEVQSSRIPFIENNGPTEATLASPAEFLPAARCLEARGIVVLVHGLSDSAFSMRDLAQTLADGCYIARIALLPGHGTKPGDLLNVRLNDWSNTVEHLIAEAAQEHDNVVTVGFSLGALLTMGEAIKPGAPIDAAITISPAFYLTTSPYAEMTRWLYPFKRWLDKEKPDDTYRYEAIPTIAVAETVKAKRRFHELLELAGSVTKPWLVIQSDDDLVVDTSKNQGLFLQHAKHAASRLITYGGASGSSETDQPSISASSSDAKLLDLNAWSDEYRVSGLTHVSIHQSPDNPHYGVQGDYRNCGSGGPRPRAAVRLCEQADTLWTGPWNQAAPDNGPYGLSTFNPDYSNMALHILDFLDESLPATATDRTLIRVQTRAVSTW